MELGILAILMGVGMISVFSGGSDDTAEDTAEPEQREPEVIDAGRADGITVGEERADGFTVLQGTGGDDLFDATTFERGLSYEVRAGDGDDIVSRNSENDADIRSSDTTNAFFGQIFGEDGDDLIDMQGRQSVDFVYEISGGIGDDTIISGDLAQVFGDAGDDLIIMDPDLQFNTGSGFGGEGNDTLDGTQGQGLYGEEGDDVINVRHLNFFNGTGTASGGAGDDVINITTGLGDVFAVQEGLRVEGNEGSDTFTLDLTITDDTQWEEGSNVGSTGIDILDFNPDEDSLVVDIDAALGEEESTYEARLVELSDDTGYNLVLDVVEDNLAEGVPQRYGLITIRTSGPMTLDDIVFTGSVPLSA